MREIFFRGKRVDNGEWVYGGYYTNGKKHFIVLEKRYKPDTRDWDIAEFYDNNPVYRPEFIEVDPSTVGQYTGLKDNNKDNNGKRIFEGDIVKYKTVCQFAEYEDLEEFGDENPDKTWNYIKPVNWHEKGGCFAPLPKRNDCEDYWYSSGTYDFEVIGNIYDNPELLEVEK